MGLESVCLLICGALCYADAVPRILHGPGHQLWGGQGRQHAPSVLALTPVGVNDDALEWNAPELGDPVGLDLYPVARPLAQLVLAAGVLHDGALHDGALHDGALQQDPIELATEVGKRVSFDGGEKGAEGLEPVQVRVLIVLQQV